MSDSKRNRTISDTVSISISSDGDDNDYYIPSTESVSSSEKSSTSSEDTTSAKSTNSSKKSNTSVDVAQVDQAKDDDLEAGTEEVTPEVYRGERSKRNEWKSNLCCACGLGLCVILLLLFAFALSSSGLVMMVLGSICVSGYNDSDGTAEHWCPSKSGSIALVVVGCIFICCCWLAAKSKK